MLAALAPELPVWEQLSRLLLAAVLAGAVGLERELRDQEAGLRTHMLVGVGATVFVLVGTYGWTELAFGNALGIVLDPSRVIAYVVTGIGFLGAGTIIKHGLNVKGLTTAASLWVVAAVGVAVGAGSYALAIGTSAAVLLSLWPVRRLAKAIGVRAQRTHRLELELGPDASVADVVASIEREGSAIASMRVSEEPDRRRLEVVVVEPQDELGRLLATASALPGVRTATAAP